MKAIDERIARLSLRLLCLVLLVACGADRESGAPFDRVVLVTIDTLRADHLASYGYPRQTAPNLERLAAEGIVFATVISPMSHTAPSHASMLTGLLPGQHGLVANGQELPEEMDNAARLFARAGMDTAAFTSVGFLGGVGRDFDTLDAKRRKGERTVRAFIEWLDAAPRSERFFAWIHLYDLHSWRYPLLTRQRHLAAMQAARPADFESFLADWHGLPELEEGAAFDWGRVTIPGEGLETFEVEGLAEAADWVDHYDARISFVDRQIARAVAAVEERFGASRTLWIITSDHGEGLGSHGHHGHGKNLYEEQLKVPLILYGLGEPIPRPRIEEMVGLVDLLPTLAEWFGQEIGHPTEGRSLLRQINGSVAGRSPVLVAHRRPVDDHRREGLAWVDEGIVAAREGRYKYIHHTKAADELYDLEADPREQRNLIDEDLEIAGRLLAYIQERMSEFESVGEVDLSAARPEVLEELEALGYVGPSTSRD